MSFPQPYILSVGLLIGCGATFCILFLLHVCRNYGLYNQHRELQQRRQKFQKVEYNLNICQNIIVSPAILCPPKPLVNSIPAKAVKFSPTLHVLSSIGDIWDTFQGKLSGKLICEKISWVTEHQSVKGRIL